MLQVHAKGRLDQLDLRLRMAAERQGGSVLAVSRVGEGATTFTLCFADRYAALLAADIRLAAFLPSRVALCEQGDAVFLEAISPRECCRMLHRPELEALAAGLEDTLRAVMEEAARPRSHDAAGERRATEDQVNMRAALPQRIDCHGSKVEELAGTGEHDSPGG